MDANRKHRGSVARSRFGCKGLVRGIRPLCLALAAVLAFNACASSPSLAPVTSGHGSQPGGSPGTTDRGVLSGGSATGSSAVRAHDPTPDVTTRHEAASPSPVNLSTVRPSAATTVGRSPSPVSGDATAGASSRSPSSPTYRFVWLADSRGTAQNEPVNTPALTAIIAAIGKISPQPAFVMFGGDMSFRGYIGTSYTYQAWEDLFAPLTNAGIPLYTALGNHELYREHQSGFFLANQQTYQSTFASNPDNGPAGYDHLTYSFTSPDGDSFFAVLDPY